MYQFKKYQRFFAVVSAAAVLGATTGCQQLPGTPGEQGAAIGGVGGAATGAAVGGEHHRLLGALLGGALGAGGGYLIGANKDKITGHDSSGAEAAVRHAQEHPATPQEALSARTADLNGDGFVTMDEVVAMKQAGLSDQQIMERLQATGQVFELTPQQQDYLRRNGVDQYIIDQMPQINRAATTGAPAPPSTPPPTGNAPVYRSPSYPQAPAPTAPSGPTTPVPPPPGP